MTDEGVERERGGTGEEREVAENRDQGPDSRDKRADIRVEGGWRGATMHRTLCRYTWQLSYLAPGWTWSGTLENTTLDNRSLGMT